MSVIKRFATEDYVSVVVEENESKFIKTINGETPNENGDMIIDIPTDEHINALINEALGVIENGYY